MEIKKKHSSWSFGNPTWSYLSTPVGGPAKADDLASGQPAEKFVTVSQPWPDKSMWLISGMHGVFGQFTIGGGTRLCYPDKGELIGRNQVRAIARRKQDGDESPASDSPPNASKEARDVSAAHKKAVVRSCGAFAGPREADHMHVSGNGVVARVQAHILVPIIAASFDMRSARESQKGVQRLAEFHGLNGLLARLRHGPTQEQAIRSGEVRARCSIAGAAP
ncbi:hypothetical protein B0E48_15405 [Rhodanobacter sp. C03]|nr:hypothetical protein B0E48_15405 [Rhodanobacter sp. C03]